MCEIWGNFLKNWYFVNNCSVKVQIKKSFLKYATHMVVIKHRTPHFVSIYLIDVQLNTDFAFKFCGFFFTVKSHIVTQRLVSQENAIKKSKNTSTFSPFKTIASNNSFIFFLKQFQVFKRAKFEFKVTVYYGRWGKSTHVWLLNYTILRSAPTKCVHKMCIELLQTRTIVICRKKIWKKTIQHVILSSFDRLW